MSVAQHVSEDGALKRRVSDGAPSPRHAANAWTEVDSAVAGAFERVDDPGSGQLHEVVKINGLGPFHLARDGERPSRGIDGRRHQKIVSDEESVNRRNP